LPRGPYAAEMCRWPRLAVLAPIMQPGPDAADKAANALHNAVMLPVVCQLTLLRS